MSFVRTLIRLAVGHRANHHEFQSLRNTDIPKNDVTQMQANNEIDRATQAEPFKTSIQSTASCVASMATATFSPSPSEIGKITSKASNNSFK
jgi:hypothetical protein